MSTHTREASARRPGATDLLDVPVVGSLLRRPGSRMIVRGAMLVLAVVMILHGFFGPQLAPKNLATLLTWVHYRGLLVLVLLVAGNFFCMACPLVLSRDVARRFITPRWHWPRRLRNKWVAIALFVAILFAYELFDLWGNPAWTASLILGYFVAAVGVDSLFKGASFCKHVCPIGQFNFAASTLSPLEVQVHDPDTCADCETLDCIKGTRAPDDRDMVIQRGCELALFQPMKVGNMDCTFCLDCVYACPHENVGITTRIPGEELASDARHSGIGRLTTRRDLSVLALVFTFGALLNAFGMVSPVYAVQAWLADVLHTQSEVPVLGTLFFAALVIEPVVLLGLAASLTRRWTHSGDKLLPIALRYAYALVPLGFGVWIAHYSFHLLTGLWTAIPVAHQALLDVGFALGPPRWGLGGFPEELVYPLEIGFLGLGLLGSLMVAHKIAERDAPERPRWAFAPWAALCIVLWVTAMWLLAQPMEMRGTFLGG